MDEYLHIGGSIVFHPLGLDFALLYGTKYGVDERGSGLAIRNLAYDKRLAVELFYLSTHLEHASTLTVIVLADVYATTCRKVGIEMKLLAFEVAHGGIA